MTTTTAKARYTALAELDAAQAAASPIATAYKHAEAAWRRSRSKANTTAILAAREAFDDAIGRCDAAYAAIDDAEADQAAANEHAEQAAMRYMQPSLF